MKNPCFKIGEDIQLTITNVNASSDSFTLRWSVFPEECYSIINSYNMVLESEVGSGSSQNAQIPLDCTEKEGSEIFFGSNNCPGLFNISPCNGYHVKVKPEVTSYETLYSGAEKLTTLPRKLIRF